MSTFDELWENAITFSFWAWKSLVRHRLIGTVFSIFLIHTVWQIFLFPIWKKIRKNRFIRKWKIIPQSSIFKQDLVMLKMKKCLHFLKFHQKLTKQSDLIFLILCIFDLLLDTCFWTGIKCLDWDCTKISQPIIFWVGAFKGNFKKSL